MGSNGTPWVSRCCVTCVITPPLFRQGTEHNADTPSRPMAVIDPPGAAGGAWASLRRGGGRAPQRGPGCLLVPPVHRCEWAAPDHVTAATTQTHPGLCRRGEGDPHRRRVALSNDEYPRYDPTGERPVKAFQAGYERNLIRRRIISRHDRNLQVRVHLRASRPGTVVKLTQHGAVFKGSEFADMSNPLVCSPVL